MEGMPMTSAAPSPLPEHRGRLPSLKHILLGLLSFFVALLAVEAAVRIAYTVHHDLTKLNDPALSQKWFVYSPVLGWERRPGYKGPVFGDEREFDKAGYLTVDSKKVTNTKARRVIFIGDSNTMGYGVPTEASFVEVVERLLPGVDAIDLGVPGYSSYQGRVTLEKYLPLLKPDVVVASFNFNDRRYAVGPNQDGPETFDRVYQASRSVGAKFAGFLEGSYAYRATRLMMSSLGLVPDVRKVRLDALKPRVDEEHYRMNLAEMAQTTRRLGIPLIFVSLNDNPVASAHLWKGINSLNKSDYNAAIEYLRVVVASKSMFADLGRIYLARVYAAKHDKGRATEILQSDSFLSLHGGRFIRLDTTYNDIMKNVAADYGVEVVDGAAALDDRDYIDFCHFDVDGHRKLGKLLAERISRVLPRTRPDH
jgi:lysophospholipase L1-like esterase